MEQTKHTVVLSGVTALRALRRAVAPAWVQYENNKLVVALLLLPSAARHTEGPSCGEGLLWSKQSTPSCCRGLQPCAP